ncbi:MAG: PAS domain S-box protein [Desulfobacterales bacterium]|nr:PAS domain S-box protein [Desulfobacterales bacterium]
MANLVNQEDFDWRLKVFESLSFPTLILNLDKIIISANKVFLKKFNFELNDIIGQACYKIFYQATEPCSKEECPIVDVVKDKKSHSVVKCIQKKNGEDRWEDRVFAPIIDDNGEITYIMESVRNITLFKCLEKELKGTKDFLEKVIQSSASGIIAADLKGNILLLNKAAEDLFGYSAKEARNKINIANFYPPGKAKEIMRKLRTEKQGGKGRLLSATIDIINSKGEKIPVEIAGSIIYEGDKEVASMGIYTDLREKISIEKKLKEAQVQITQSEKLASLGQLAAGVAHEINNPLTGIMIYASMVIERLDENDPNKEDLKCVLEDAERCKEIVKNLLAYSRQANPSMEIIHINSLVEQSLTLIRDQELLMNIHVIKEMSDEMMLIHVDRNQFHQVLINLIINAVDAMNKKGTLTFKTYRNRIEKEVYLEVGDTGCGIPEEHINKIFDPFFTTKEPGKGTGLGLSTVYGIVQENGGNIRIKTSTSKGTTFLIELPLYQISANDALLI